MRKSTLVLVVLAGCSFSSKLTTSGPGSSTSSGGGGGGGSKIVVVPDLYGLTLEQAAAKMREAGFTRGPEKSMQNYACDMDRRPHYDVGQICYHHPVPGTQTSSSLPISVQIQADYDDHGNIGFAGEWRSMPDVVGKTVTAARSMLAGKKMPLDEHFELLEDDCAEGTVCRTSPQPGERKVLARKGRLWVGKKAAVVPPPTQPTQPAQPSQPEQPGGFF
jgi:beta-lactam-binding protein with PASTA domain